MRGTPASPQPCPSLRSRSRAARCQRDSQDRASRRPRSQPPTPRIQDSPEQELRERTSRSVSPSFAPQPRGCVKAVKRSGATLLLDLPRYPRRRGWRDLTRSARRPSRPLPSAKGVVDPPRGGRLGAGANRTNCRRGRRDSPANDGPGSSGPARCRLRCGSGLAKGLVLRAPISTCPCTGRWWASATLRQMKRNWLIVIVFVLTSPAPAHAAAVGWGPNRRGELGQLHQRSTAPGHCAAARRGQAGRVDVPLELRVAGTMRRSGRLGHAAALARVPHRRR